MEYIIKINTKEESYRVIKQTGTEFKIKGDDYLFNGLFHCKS